MDKNELFPPYLELCLNFANTLEWHASEQPVETLHGYTDLVAWAQQANVLTDAEAAELTGQAGRFSTEAAQVYIQAIDLREAIYQIFAAVATEQNPAPTDLAILNAALPAAYSHWQIVQTADGFAWGWTGTDKELDCILWPVVRSAADLLLFKELSRVRQCADDRGCGDLFIDTTRNHSRRWCTMESCGNRAKARRHYSRTVRQ